MVLLAFIFGLIISIPIGPLGQLIINRSLNRGFWNGFTIAIFDAIINFSLCMFFLMGVTAFEINPIAKIILNSIGLVYLLYVGIKELIISKKNIANNLKLKINESLSRKNIFENFAATMLYYLSNPVTWAFWINFSNFIKEKILFNPSEYTIVLFSFLFSIGVITSQYLGIKVMKNLQKVEKLKKIVVYASTSLFVITFGYFFFSVVNSILELSLKT